ncbi:MAG: hypothetical protein JNN31_06065 [Dechloromonas sp.]|nr:hypothetical protein [Dechloromonas sp.]
MSLPDSELLDVLKGKLGIHTDAEVARILGVSSSDISQIRSNRRRLPDYPRFVAYDLLGFPWAKSVLKYVFYEDLKQNDEKFKQMNALRNKFARDACLYYSGALYINLPMIRAFIATTPAAGRLGEIPSVDSIEQLRDSLEGLQVWCQQALAEAKLKIAPLVTAESAHALTIGDVRSFELSVRTRRVGYWGVSKMVVGEIYGKTKGSTYSIAINPVWITCSHAYAILSSGITRLCGIFSVRHVDQDKNIVFGEPIILGEPASDSLRQMDPNRYYLLCKNNET